MTEPVDRAVFCDFDGTITETETFVDMLRAFAPEPAARVIPRIYDLTTTLRDGVTEMLESISSDLYDQAIAHADTASLRPGLAELIDACAAHGVPFVVVSGGLHDMVVRRLGPLAARVTAVHAVRVDRSGPRWRVVSEWADHEELVAKVRVMAAHPARERVAIGDSTTDLRMSEVAERVFARRRLCDYLDEREIPYERWDDFRDVHRALAAAWGWPAPSPSAPPEPR